MTMAAFERVLRTGGVKKVKVSPIAQNIDTHSFNATIEFGSPTPVHIPGNELRGLNYFIDHSIMGNRHTLHVSGTNLTAIKDLHRLVSEQNR